MSKLQLNIKKTLLKRKVNGVVTEGYYGRVITNGTKSFKQLAEDSCVNTTVHKAETNTPPANPDENVLG